MKFLSGLKDRLSKAEKFSLGLDIGTQSIKAVKLKLSNGTAELCGFSLEPAQPELSEVLKKIKQSQGEDIANISFSGSSTVIRYVNFPKMNKEELKQALKFEAQKYIPFLLSEVNLDSSIIKEDLPDNKMLVLLAAVKKDLLTQRLKIMEDSGFKVNVIDLDSVALTNAFNFGYLGDDNLKNKTIALLNIGASVSNLNIIENGIPRLSRDIFIAGNNFTRKIMDIFALDFNPAENLKFNPDSEDKINRLKACIEVVLTNLATELRTSFDYYESQSAASVVKIILSGGGSGLTGLKDMLVNALNIEVEHWDPLKNINMGDAIDSEKLKQTASRLAVAIGLALRA